MKLNKKNGYEDKVLLTFWERLQSVTQLTFHAKTKEETGWNGVGQGDVLVTQQDSDTLIFEEKGTWQGTQGEEVTFSNIFRWTFDRNVGLISLEHLRKGPGHPVFLFHIAPINKHSLSSVDSHLCGKDSYFGQIHLNHSGFLLKWRVTGPKKNEEIDYQYTTL